MKTTHYVLRTMLVITLCVVLCIIPSFGLRLSTAFSADIFSEDAVTFTDITPPLNVMDNTSAVQYKNILSVMALSLGTIDDLRFNLKVYPLSGINDTSFRFYDYNPEDEFAFTFTDNTDYTGQLVVT